MILELAKLFSTSTLRTFFRFATKSPLPAVALAVLGLLAYGLACAASLAPPGLDSLVVYAGLVIVIAIIGIVILLIVAKMKGTPPPATRE